MGCSLKSLLFRICLVNIWIFYWFWRRKLHICILTICSFCNATNSRARFRCPQKYSGSGQQLFFLLWESRLQVLICVTSTLQFGQMFLLSAQILMQSRQDILVHQSRLVWWISYILLVYMEQVGRIGPPMHALDMTDLRSRLILTG